MDIALRMPCSRSRGREAMARSVIEGGLSKAAAAHQFHTTPKTVAKWVGRCQAEGVAGLQDRSSRPHSSPKPNGASPMRRHRRSAKAASPTGRADRRGGRGFWPPPSAEPAEPVRRYERATPGEILHGSSSRSSANSIALATASPAIALAAGKTSRIKLGICAVWRSTITPGLAYSEILPDETRACCLRFLFNALRFFFEAFGVKRLSAS